jgi:D-aminopeptidase
MSGKPRGRELGLPFRGTPGPLNAITDVPGVLVGLTTLIEGEGPLVPGRGPVRTGVTAILPRGREPAWRPVWAGFHAFNGNGEMTGVHWIREGGWLAGPILLTNTHAVGIAHHAAVRWMLRTHAAAFAEAHRWAMPVVAETYDGVLNDINGLHLAEDHVLQALDRADGGPVAEGSSGGGTGMIAYEFKAGTGSASRRVGAGGLEGVVGVLVQANHGRRPQLQVLGVPIGEHLVEDRLFGPEAGSIVVVVATDLPLLPHQLARLARRAGLGMARGGTTGGNGSGDLFLAFSTAGGPELGAASGSHGALGDGALDPLFAAVVEAVEEAVVNALLAAEPMRALRPAGRLVPALPADRLLALMRRHGRLAQAVAEGPGRP